MSEIIKLYLMAGDIPELDERLVRRLTFVKYLYNQAMSYCSHPNNSSSFSIGLLLLHDASENCLAAVAANMNIKLKYKIFLLEYLDLIRDKDNKNRDIPFDSDLDELNTLRINIKHKGILPDTIQHRELPERIGKFLSYMFEEFLNREFSNIGLISFIQNENVRTRLQKAEDYFEKKAYKECLIELAFAMHYIVGFPPSFYLIWEKDTINEVTEVFPDIGFPLSDIELLEHNVEPTLFYRFRNITPKIGIKGHINNLIYKWDDIYGHPKNWSELNCGFCLEFCIDTAIKFQRKSQAVYKIVHRMDAFIQRVTPKDRSLDVWASYGDTRKKYRDQSIDIKPLFSLKENEALLGVRIGYMEEEEIQFVIHHIVKENGSIEEFGDRVLGIVKKNESCIEDIEI